METRPRAGVEKRKRRRRANHTATRGSVGAASSPVAILKPRLVGVRDGVVGQRFVASCLVRDILATPRALPANALDGRVSLQLGREIVLPSAVTPNTRPPSVTT